MGTALNHPTNAILLLLFITSPIFGLALRQKDQNIKIQLLKMDLPMKKSLCSHLHTNPLGPPIQAVHVAAEIVLMTVKQKIQKFKFKLCSEN